jgi:hypothetical protein
MIDVNGTASRLPRCMFGADLLHAVLSLIAAPPFVCQRDGASALWLACAAGYAEVVQVLLLAGADREVAMSVRRARPDYDAREPILFDRSFVLKCSPRGCGCAPLAIHSPQLCEWTPPPTPCLLRSMSMCSCCKSSTPTSCGGPQAAGTSLRLVTCAEPGVAHSHASPVTGTYAGPALAARARKAHTLRYCWERLSCVGGRFLVDILCVGPMMWAGGGWAGQASSSGGGLPTSGVGRQT